MKNRRAFIQFRSYYLFDAQFCAPAKGNEKGQVEKLVQTARAQFLVPVPQVSDLQVLNHYLLEQCDAYEETYVPKTKEQVGERFLLEKQQLLPIIGTHPCAYNLS
ncbi:hypothetical protein OC195_10080 [Priestia flexa]|nr:hypothetical protein OC195_10080 [Priestia flexa]